MKYTALVPYRTVATLLLILFSSPFLILRFGLGLSSMVPMLMGVTVGLLILLLPLGMLKGRLTKRLIETIRTVLALVAVFYVTIGYINNSGVGAMIAQSFRLFEFEGVWRAVLPMLVVTLIVDVLTGCAQQFLTQRPNA